jgi:hypothetical protein
MARALMKIDVEILGELLKLPKGTAMLSAQSADGENYHLSVTVEHDSIPEGTKQVNAIYRNDAFGDFHFDRFDVVR